MDWNIGEEEEEGDEMKKSFARQKGIFGLEALKSFNSIRVEGNAKKTPSISEAAPIPLSSFFTRVISP